jgi:nitrate/TMAO reductase-like tetraheme cytochrome c subunit
MNWRLLLCLAIAAFGLGLVVYATSANPIASVSGQVVGQDGPLGGATVRMRATDNYTFTQPDGTFSLFSLEEGQQIELTAWADGYYIASTHVTPTVSGITLTLRPYHTRDHPDYEWTSPISGTSSGACGNCHPMILPQWENNAHGGAVFNPRFLSLYNGTDLSGTIPVSPGYLGDFPSTSGNCASCHAPGAGVDGYLTTNMNAVRDVITAGIHCDYCHKIGGVYLNPATGSVYPNTPGVLSQRLLRPPAGDNIFFGPYDDIRDPDTYLPEISESQFCAPCHQFSFWGTPIYESYNEWLASDYAELGVTCQKCHMPPNGDTYFALPEMGGLEHPAERIPSHLQLGARNTELLQETVSMILEVEQQAGWLWVSVELTNFGAGHHVPTDHPGRHMILSVRALDENGGALTQLGGPTVPPWGGVQAGLPGKLFAKVLRDALNGALPVVSYWKQTFVDSDNRIPALGSDTSLYIFQAPSSGERVTARAELIFRRLFQEEAQARSWNEPDILMEGAQVELVTAPWISIYAPFIQR